MQSRATPGKLLQRFETDGFENLRQATAGGRGALIVFPHLGSFPVLAFLSAHRGIPTSVVALYRSNTVRAMVLQRICDRFGLELIQVDRKAAGRSNVVDLCEDALRRGRTVAISGAFGMPGIRAEPQVGRAEQSIE